MYDEYRYEEEIEPEAAALIDVLTGLEPMVKEAGDLARALQGKVEVEMKASSGNIRTDVVTEADRSVQQRILASMVETPLVKCRLLAEETPSAGVDDLRERFAGEGRFFLTIDPIDGTSRYTRNQPYYSTIIGLHDGRRPLYTFMHYPAFGWWVRIANLELTPSADPPVDVGDKDLRRTIVYTAGDPERDAAEAMAMLRRHGAEIVFGESLGPWGSKYLYLSGHAGGYFGGEPNPYDGLFGLHCAMARGNRVLCEGLDLTKMVKGPYGMHHPGWYVVVPLVIDGCP
jgi:fructose-1,6-bisphosphatase/inositol monophosphatase family enzyme